MHWQCKTYYFFETIFFLNKDLFETERLVSNSEWSGKKEVRVFGESCTLVE